MNISVIGTGYVGLVTGVGLANSGNDVLCMDVDPKKIETLRNGESPIYEPGLESLIQRNIREGRLKFSTSIEEAVEFAEVIFIAVGTPPQEDGSANLSYVKKVASSIGEHMNSYKVVVNKSTVPVGTFHMVTEIVQEAINKRQKELEFDVVSNPEFLREGAAVDDFLKPDRIIIGSNSDRAVQLMKKIYLPFVSTPGQLLIMDPLSSEMSKYAANCMLATKISFINEVANICEKTGADVTKVKLGIGSDPRIGPHFINAGIGYGGSCFPKDVKALIHIAKTCDFKANILEAVDMVNKNQRMIFIEKIKKELEQIQGKKVAVWGLAFKPETDDMRDAPSIDVISALLEMGIEVEAFDPKARHEAETIFGDKITYEETDMYAVLKNADMLLVLTEWKEFYNPNFKRILELMSGNILMDGRNIFQPEEMQAQGFHYLSIGR